MKNVFLCLCILCLSQASFAQQSSSIIKLDGLVALSPYGAQKSGGAQLQYDLLWPGRWSLSTALGFAGHVYQESFFSINNLNNMPWGEEPKLGFEEQFAHLDAHLLYSLTDNTAAHNLKVGLGLSGLLIELQYPGLVGFDQNGIIKVNYEKRENWVLMTNFVLDYDIKLGTRLMVHLKSVFRIKFEDLDDAVVHPFNEIHNDGSSFDDIGDNIIVDITRNNLQNNLALSIGLGYRL